MTATCILKRIKELSFPDGRCLNEERFRNLAGEIYLFVTSSSYSEKEKDFFLRKLKKALRRIPQGNPFPLYNVRIDSFLGEICLAVNFYLLKNSKSVSFEETEESLFAKINPVAFENCFFSFLSVILKKNNKASVRVKTGEKHSFAVISADSLCLRSEFFFRQTVFVKHEKEKSEIYIPLTVSKNVLPDYEEDFSLLLADPLSPLQTWLCDI